MKLSIGFASALAFATWIQPAPAPFVAALIAAGFGPELIAAGVEIGINGGSKLRRGNRDWNQQLPGLPFSNSTLQACLAETLKSGMHAVVTDDNGLHLTNIPHCWITAVQESAA